MPYILKMRLYIHVYDTCYIVEYLLSYMIFNLYAYTYKLNTVYIHIQCEQDLSIPADQGPIKPQIAHEVPRRQH